MTSYISSKKPRINKSIKYVQHTRSSASAIILKLRKDVLSVTVQYLSLRNSSVKPISEVDLILSAKKPVLYKC